MNDTRPAVVEPRNVEEARRAVEDSRERISHTLDSLEVRLLETRERVREKADLARPLRERTRARPWLAVGIAAGVGVLLGLVGRRGAQNGRSSSSLSNGAGGGPPAG